MGKQVNADSLSNAITGILSTYSDEMTEGIKQDVDEVTNETLKILKENAPVKYGKYRKKMKKKKLSETLTERENILYVDGAKAHLTHLLENGHALRQGGRAPAHPHFRLAEEYAVKELSKKTKKTIKET